MKQGGNQDLDQSGGMNNDNEEDVHEQFISKFTPKKGSTIADRRLQKLTSKANHGKGTKLQEEVTAMFGVVANCHSKRKVMTVGEDDEGDVLDYASRQAAMYTKDNLNAAI